MRILLCDDHQMMRDGLRAVLERAGFEVVGEAANGRQSLSLARQLSPDVVIMDISMPELNGIDATRKLVAELPHVKVLGLSMNSDRRYATSMFTAGAVGYLLKNSAAEELIQALEAIASGLTYVSPAIGQSGVEESALGDPSPASARNPAPTARAKALSPREREVLQLLAEGKSSKEIAASLDIAATTVETHRRQLMQKLDLRTIAELTKYAVREGLTSLD